MARPTALHRKAWAAQRGAAPEQQAPAGSGGQGAVGLEARRKRALEARGGAPGAETATEAARTPEQVVPAGPRSMPERAAKPDRDPQAIRADPFSGATSPIPRRIPRPTQAPTRFRPTRWACRTARPMQAMTSTI